MDEKMVADENRCRGICKEREMFFADHFCPGHVMS